MIGQVLAEEYSLQRILGPETGTIPGYMHLIQEPSPSNLQLKQLQLLRLVPLQLMSKSCLPTLTAMMRFVSQKSTARKGGLEVMFE